MNVYFPAGMTKALGGVEKGEAKHMLVPTETRQQQRIGADAHTRRGLQGDRRQKHRRSRIADKHGQQGRREIDARHQGKRPESPQSGHQPVGNGL